MSEEKKEYLPHGVIENEFLARLNPEELEKIQKDIAYSMIRRKTFDDARVLKRWQVIIDRRVRLADIAELTVGYVGNMAKQYKEMGVKFLRSLNIKPFHIVEDDLKYISEEFSESLSKSILHENDLIIVRTGMPGTCCVVPKEYENCNCADVVSL